MTGVQTCALPISQIGSILGPTLATQADWLGIATLYLVGAVVMFLMVAAMFLYVGRFGAPEEGLGGREEKSGKSDEGVMEGFNLFYEHDYVKGIFAVSSLYMVG